MSIKSEGECTITLTRLSVLENIEKKHNNEVEYWQNKYEDESNTLWVVRSKHLVQNYKRDTRIVGMRQDYYIKEAKLSEEYDTKVKDVRKEYEQKFIQHKKDFKHNLNEKIREVNDAIRNKNIELAKEVEDISIYKFIKLKYFTKTK
jgi:hypothetical protein